MAAGAMTLTVPAGALDGPVTIVATADSASPSGYSLGSARYHFEPAGLHFSKPVTVRIPTTRTSAISAVYWSNDADPTKFERLTTTFENGFASAQVSHFSDGFVGDQPLTCTTQRAVQDAFGNCTEQSTVETDLHLWLSFQQYGPEALTTDSPGLGLLFNSRADAPFFYASDTTHTHYGNSETGFVVRDGDVATLTVDARRGESAICMNLPFVIVRCEGSVVFGPPPPDAPDGGADSGADADSGSEEAVDAGPPIDGDAGVTCITKRRVFQNDDCVQSVETESVQMYLVVNQNRTDAQGGITLDSPGMAILFNVAVSTRYPYFQSLDGTHTYYSSPIEQAGGAQRNGAVASVSFHAARGGPIIETPECLRIPLVDVTCSGAGPLH